VSGLPTLDTVGLMDRHIARLPGRIHEKLDLGYVLSRRPRAIVLNIGDLVLGLPHDRFMASHEPFLDAYHLAYVVPFGKSCYYVFVANDGPPRPLPPPVIDLASRLPSASRTVSGPDGIEDARRKVRLGGRFVTLQPAREQELIALVPRSLAEVTPERIARLDAAFRELAPASRHGIAVHLPPGFSEATITFRVQGPVPDGSRLLLALGYAPWRRPAGSRESATLTASIEQDGGAVARTEVTAGHGDAGVLPLALPASGERLRVVLTVRRSGPPGATSEDCEVLIEDPRIAWPEPSP
jgi:hypothetical protein